jgi:hypothetical protein
MVDVEADFFQVEAEEVYFYGIVADLVIYMCVFDAVVDGFEILSGGFTTEETESTEGEKQKVNTRIAKCWE